MCFDKNFFGSGTLTYKLIWEAETITNSYCKSRVKAGIVNKLCVFQSFKNWTMCFKWRFVWVKVYKLTTKFTSFGRLRFYLRYSSSEKLSRLSSSSLPSSSGRSPQSSRFCPVASSLLMVDTASLLNIQKCPLLQESKQGLHGATTWYPTTFPHFKQAMSLNLHLQLSVE